MKVIDEKSWRRAVNVAGDQRDEQFRTALREAENYADAIETAVYRRPDQTFEATVAGPGSPPRPSAAAIAILLDYWVWRDRFVRITTAWDHGFERPLAGFADSIKEMISKKAAANALIVLSHSVQDQDPFGCVARATATSPIAEIAAQAIKAMPDLMKRWFHTTPAGDAAAQLNAVFDDVTKNVRYQRDPYFGEEVPPVARAYVPIFWRDAEAGDRIWGPPGNPKGWFLLLDRSLVGPSSNLRREFPVITLPDGRSVCPDTTWVSTSEEKTWHLVAQEYFVAYRGTLGTTLLPSGPPPLSDFYRRTDYAPRAVFENEARACFDAHLNLVTGAMMGHVVEDARGKRWRVTVRDASMRKSLPGNWVPCWPPTIER